MKRKNHRIDVHYHLIPKPYVKELESRGIRGSTYVPFPDWTPEKALGHLDRGGIRTAVTSLSTPGVWFGDVELARKLSRLSNEFQARMVSDHPGRFGSFAALPLPDVEGSLREVEYALDELGHHGVCLLSDAGGRYLGHPDYEELFAELDRRRAVVFIHPTDDPREEKRYALFSPLLEWPIHTTRTAMDLLYSGRLERYRNIRFILAHGGGAIPVLAHRLVNAPAGRQEQAMDWGFPGEEDDGCRERLDALKGLYFDTAAPGASHLAALKAFAGTGQILFGTDGGWTPPVQTALSIKELLAFDGFDATSLPCVESGNALALFPELGTTESPRGPEESSAVQASRERILGATAQEASPDHGPGSTISSESLQTAEDPTTDVHHHMLPPFYLDALQDAGWARDAFPRWSPERSMEAMEEMGVERALLSISTPGVWWGDDAKARSLARRCNEFAATVMANHPTRFGGLAALPFPDLQGSITEVEHALDDLGLDGVILYSNVDGRYVGDAEFEPLLEALHHRQALVLLHPNFLPANHPNAALHSVAEYPVDLGRSYVRLALNDAFLKYPDVRWVLAHAGGVVPYLAPRLGKAHYVDGERGKLKWVRILKDLLLKRNGGLDLAREVGYEIGSEQDSIPRRALEELVGPERLFMGSNFPWRALPDRQPEAGLMKEAER